MSQEIAGMPRKNPCYGCVKRTATCHVNCRDHELYRVICRAHRNKFKADMDKFNAPKVDRIYQSVTMTGKAPILQTVKHKKYVKGEIR